MKVAFELTTPDGHFVCHGADGKEIRVEAGKTLTTGDPKVIAELSAHPHAVKRVKSKGEEA